MAVVALAGRPRFFGAAVVAALVAVAALAGRPRFFGAAFAGAVALAGRPRFFGAVVAFAGAAAFAGRPRLAAGLASSALIEDSTFLEAVVTFLFSAVVRALTLRASCLSRLLRH